MQEEARSQVKDACEDPRPGSRELTLSLTQNTGPLENTRWRAARKLARARGDGDAYAYARGTVARAHVARVAAVEDATATDGVLPAQGLGGDRRRRSIANGVFGGVITNHHIYA